MNSFVGCLLASFVVIFWCIFLFIYLFDALLFVFYYPVMVGLCRLPILLIQFFSSDHIVKQYIYKQ